jgi:hypothetical protein
MDDMDGMADMDAVNLVDLAFVVDTTGSMGGLIGAAQHHMIRMGRSRRDLLDGPEAVGP